MFNCRRARTPNRKLFFTIPLSIPFKIGLFQPSLFTLLALSCLLLIYPIRKIFLQKNPDLLFLTAFLLYILFELFIPAPRYNYTFIQWLFGLSIILTSNKIILNPYWGLLIVLGLLMNMGLFNFIPRYMTIGEFLIFGATWLVLFDNRKKPLKNCTSIVG